MAVMSLQVKDLAGLLARLKDREADLIAGLRDGLERGAKVVQFAARENCPVASGRLRRSIAQEVKQEGKSLVARIGTNVEYGPYVERGTRPHLAPIGMSNEGRIWLRKHGFVDAKGDVPGYIPVSGRAQPFLLPALEAKKDRVVEEVGGGLRRAARRISRRNR